jgi:DNA-binding NarL/FixJ family response regulator
MTYEKKANRINVRHKQELENELCLLKSGKERLDYYIGFLTERQAKIIRHIYFEGKTITEVSLSLSLSETTVKITRRNGITRLLEMYSIISC